MAKSLFKTEITEPLCIIRNSRIVFSKSLIGMTDLEIDQVSEFISDHFHSVGLISCNYYRFSEKKLNNSIFLLDRLDIDNLFDNNTILSNQIGVSVASSFHPHMLDVESGHFNSPTETFSDKRFFTRSIKKYLGTIRNDRCTLFLDGKNIVDILRTASKTQMVSNFRPSVAKYIYEKYGNKGIVLDPCAGYGGRLLGAWCSNIQKYVGVDPCAKTIEGNRNLYAKLAELTEYKSLFGIHRPKIELYQVPFEEFETTEKFDLVFTSPPYFNTEKYSHEDTQSWVRYKTYSAWLKGFLEPLIRKSHEYLKSGGYFVINTKDEPKKKQNLYADCFKIADKYFGKPVEVKQMRLSLLPLLMKDKKAPMYKFEPIAIFRKT